MKSRLGKKIIRLNVFAVVSFVVVGFFGFCMYLRTQYVVPILMYHRVNNWADKSDLLTVKEKTFQRQMKFLHDNKYNVISLDDLVNLIKLNKKIPPETVLVTFDDGYVDNYEVAYPILKKYHIPATIFVITSLIDKDPGMLSRSQLKEMTASGLIEIGSHTINHACLNKTTSLAELKKEIGQSKKDLEAILGREVKFLSYPIGGFSPVVRNITIGSGYKAAVSVNSGKYYPDNEIFGMKRLRISENARNLVVFWFESTGYYTWFKEEKSGKEGKGSYIQCQLVR